MNYIGSKLSLLEFLETSIDTVIGDSVVGDSVVAGGGGTFCDMFAGTGIVGSHFKKKGYKVIANDIQYYSYVLNRHYIGNRTELPFTQLTREIAALKKIDVERRKDFVCDYLSNLKGAEGFVYQNYCLGGTHDSAVPRQYFSDDNGKQCDAIRQRIERWKEQRLISDDEYYFLIASLIESVDKHANTASVYGAFLKRLKKSAQSRFFVKPADLIVSEQSHEVFQTDTNEIARRVSGDIFYFDPPYNHRQYATNYHLLETIARYDAPQIYGKTGLREYGDQKSRYCSRMQVKSAFKDLMLNSSAKYVFLSYNNEGLLTLDDIKEIMSLRGVYGCFTKDYSRFKADKSANRSYAADTTTEYLHYVVCQHR